MIKLKFRVLVFDIKGFLVFSNKETAINYHN